MDAASTPAAAAATETWIQIYLQVFLILFIYIPLASIVGIVWWFGLWGLFLTSFWMPICIVTGQATRWDTTQDAKGNTSYHGVGLKDYGQVDPKRVRQNGILIFLGCFTAFPVLITPFCLESRDMWGEEAYAAYPNAFRTAWKAWLILWMAYATLWIGVVVAMIVEGIFASSRKNARNSAGGILDNPPKDKDTEQSPSHGSRLSTRQWLYVLSPLLFSVLTAWNILVYASRYGIFVRHGNFTDFMYCYLYCCGQIFSVLEFIVPYIVGWMCLAAALYLTYKLIRDIIYSFKAPVPISERKRRTLNEDWQVDCDLGLWTVITFGTWCIAIGLLHLWFSLMGCNSMRVKALDAAKIALKPGNEEMMLTWGLVTNTTGTYNVTMEPYRPYNPFADPNHYRYEPVMVEYGCGIVALFVFPRYAGYAMVAMVAYLLVQLFRERMALRQGADTKGVKV